MSDSVLAEPRSWELARTVPGWLMESEARALYEASTKIAVDECLVEIGAFRGRSTIVLAETGSQVLTIDRMETGHHDGNGMSVTDEDVEALQRIVGSYRNVQWVRMYSDNVRPPDNIGLLFIDGDHRAPQPLNDFNHFVKGMKHGGTVCFHDYHSDYPAVMQAVDKLVEHGRIAVREVVDRLAICTVLVNFSSKPTRITRVDGIEMLVLCHRFGRRCRTFLHSLFQQRDMLVPIRLVLFYSRLEDIDTALIGMCAGTPNIEYDCRRIPEADIMYRPKLYARYRPALGRSYSHVLYTDCDLWFPPTFFHDYVEVLRGKPRGYYGSFVREIAYDDAEVCIMDDRYRGLNETILSKLASPKPRYDETTGRAGHFQMVPRELSCYPDVDTFGVAYTDDKFALEAVARSDDTRPERRISDQCAYHLGHPNAWKGTTLEL